MSGILGQNGIVAVALFASIALAMLALVLVWEGIRRLQRQRSLVTQLRALGKPGSIASGGASGLLRAVEKQGPAWAESLMLRLPHQRDLKNFLEQGDVGWTVGTFLMLTVGSAAAFGLSAMVLTPTPVPLVAAATEEALRQVRGALPGSHRHSGQGHPGGTRFLDRAGSRRRGGQRSGIRRIQTGLRGAEVRTSAS
jgi:hypothetical protein